VRQILHLGVLCVFRVARASSSSSPRHPTTRALLPQRQHHPQQALLPAAQEAHRCPSARSRARLPCRAPPNASRCASVRRQYIGHTHRRRFSHALIMLLVLLLFVLSSHCCRLAVSLPLLPFSPLLHPSPMFPFSLRCSAPFALPSLARPFSDRAAQRSPHRPGVRGARQRGGPLPVERPPQCLRRRRLRAVPLLGVGPGLRGRMPRLAPLSRVLCRCCALSYEGRGHIPPSLPPSLARPPVLAFRPLHGTVSGTARTAQAHTAHQATRMLSFPNR